MRTYLWHLAAGLFSRKCQSYSSRGALLYVYIYISPSMPGGLTRTIVKHLDCPARTNINAFSFIVISLSDGGTAQAMIYLDTWVPCTETFQRDLSPEIEISRKYTSINHFKHTSSTLQAAQLYSLYM